MKQKFACPMPSAIFSALDGRHGSGSIAQFIDETRLFVFALTATENGRLGQVRWQCRIA